MIPVETLRTSETYLVDGKSDALRKFGIKLLASVMDPSIKYKFSFETASPGGKPPFFYECKPALQMIDKSDWPKDTGYIDYVKTMSTGLAVVKDARSWTCRVATHWSHPGGSGDDAFTASSVSGDNEAEALNNAYLQHEASLKVLSLKNVKSLTFSAKNGRCWEGANKPAAPIGWPTKFDW